MRFRLHIIAGWLAIFACCGPARAARAPDVSPDGLWVDVPVLQSLAATNLWVNPPVFRAVALDHVGMRAQLAGAPLEQAGAPFVMWLPMPDGSFERFAVSEAPVMAPELQAMFPDIRTYVGQGVDDGAARVRLDLTPAGFHAQVLSPKGAAYIDKHTRDAGVYAAYWKKDHQRIADSFRCLVAGNERPALQSSGPSLQGISVGATLRRYRLAVAATGEYTAFHGGTVTGGLAAVVTTVNRVTGIYESELAIRLTLVANNNLLIYTNSATDPYTNDNADLLLTQNQSNTDTVIGNANYDIGHVVNTDGGGQAVEGVCETGWKAQGETGNPAPVGDSFDVDYVAHEIGHQFSASHTFNSSSGSCSGNRVSAQAYEVGSGSTIMAYAGICGGDNIQSQSDPFFHSASFDQIMNYVTAGLGATCPVLTPTSNGPPSASAGPAYTIPMSTPFALTASGSDTNGDVLTYCWEERDLGPAQTLGSGDNGSSPLFRAFAPTTNPTRYFPRLTNLLNNTTNLAEKLPTTARTMNFRVTVRDNRAGGGGVTNADTSVTVATNSGPFVVTSFNSGGTFSGLVAVTWNVAGTTGTPVNAANVMISLSTNGGSDFHYVLVASVPNSGSNNVLLPNIVSSKARIKVSAVGNCFFDVNNTNFAIALGAPTPFIIAASNTLIGESCLPTNGAVDAEETVTFNFALQNTGNGSTSNITATLLTNSIVTGVASSQTYGALSPGGASVSRAFTFTVAGPCGSSASCNFLIKDGTSVLTTVSSILTIGTLAEKYSQTFDGVTAPALPAGWSTSQSNAQVNWATTTTDPDSGPNAAFSPAAASVGVNQLVSPSWFILTAAAKLTFRHQYELEEDYDGGVLEIKMGTNGFADVLAAGGTFQTNGYVPVAISAGFSNPLAGRACWSGSSVSYKTTVLKLPAAAAGQNVQFRWRCGTDTSVGAAGWWVDGISLSDAVCCTGGPSADLALTMSRSPLNIIASQQVVFVISVTNRGPNEASSVLISNPVSSIAKAVSANASQGTSTTNGGTILCNLGTLSNGATASATIVLAALNPAAQIASLTNVAVISSSVSDPVATNNTTSATAVVFKDSVGDGVPDFWRQQHFGSATTTNATSCATCDADGDGFNNRSEFLADTMPTNSSSYLRIEGLAAETPTQQVFFATSTGRIYAVEFNDGIATGFWQLSNGFVPGAGGTNYSTSTNAVSPGFFRLKAALP